MPLWKGLEDAEHPRVANLEDAEHPRVAKGVWLDSLEI